MESVSVLKNMTPERTESLLDDVIESDTGVTTEMVEELGGREAVVDMVLE